MNMNIHIFWNIAEIRSLHESFNLNIDIITFFLLFNIRVFHREAHVIFCSRFLGTPRGTNKTPNYLQTDEKNSSRYQSGTNDLKFCCPAEICKSIKRHRDTVQIYGERSHLTPAQIPEARLSTTNHHDDQPSCPKSQANVEDDIASTTVSLQVIIDFLLQPVNLFKKI